MAFKKGHTAWNLNRKWTLEEKKRISNGRKGIPSLLRGVPRTIETKEKISTQVKRAWAKKNT